MLQQQQEQRDSRIQGVGAAVIQPGAMPFSEGALDQGVRSGASASSLIKAGRGLTGVL